MRVYRFHHSRIWLFQGCVSSTSCGKATLYITQEFAIASANAATFGSGFQELLCAQNHFDKLRTAGTVTTVPSVE